MASLMTTNPYLKDPQKRRAMFGKAFTNPAFLKEQRVSSLQPRGATLQEASKTETIMG